MAGQRVAGGTGLSFETVKSSTRTFAIGISCLAAGIALALGINAHTNQGELDAQTLPAETRAVPLDPQQLLLSYSAARLTTAL
jgi:hypothetical protein